MNYWVACILKKHPDKGGDHEEFCKLHAAYELLKANIPTVLGYGLVVHYQDGMDIKTDIDLIMNIGNITREYALLLLENHNGSVELVIHELRRI